MEKRRWKGEILLSLLMANLIFSGSELCSQDMEKSPWNEIILRVDDGPSKKTAELSETLRELSIKNVIFNLIGDNIERNGKIGLEMATIVAAIIYQYDYEVGNHTFSHPHLSSEKVRQKYENDLEKWEREIDNAQKVINQALEKVGKGPYQCKIFACPGGPWNLTQTLKEVVIAKGLTPDEGWDIDTQDSFSFKKRLTPEEIAIQIQEKIAKLTGKRKVVLLIHERKDWVQDLRAIDKILRERKIILF